MALARLLLLSFGTVIARARGSIPLSGLLLPGGGPVLGQLLPVCRQRVGFKGSGEDARYSFSLTHWFSSALPRSERGFGFMTRVLVL